MPVFVLGWIILISFSPFVNFLSALQSRRRGTKIVASLKDSFQLSPVLKTQTLLPELLTHPVFIIAIFFCQDKESLPLSPNT